MEKLAYHINKSSTKSLPKPYICKLNNIVLIVFFIFLFSSFVSICSYTYHFSIFTDYDDRHYIFLLCNGILAFLIMNFDSTCVFLPKEIQPVITYDIKHQPMLMTLEVEEHIEETEEKYVEIEEQEQETEETYVEIEEHEEETEEIYVETEEQEEIYDENEVEDVLAVVVQQERGESKESVETEELNKRCAEFIAKMRLRMKFESLPGHSQLSSTKMNATASF